MKIFGPQMRLKILNCENCNNLRYLFWLADPEVFSKRAFGASIYEIIKFEMEAGAKKNVIFWSKVTKSA